MRLTIVVAFTLICSGPALASKCEKIDDPAGYSYVECDPAKIKAAKEAAKTATQASERKPKPKSGADESVEEFSARMAVENAKNEEERRAAQARADAARQEQDRKQAKAGKDRGAAAEKAEAEFKQAAQAGRIGAWQYRIEQEKMGSGTIKYASTQSKNEVNFKFPYLGKQRATLLLRAHPRYGRDVVLSVEKGQLLCELDGCNLLVRFGDAKPRKFSAARSADHSPEVLFIREHDQFAANLKKVGKVLVEVQVYQNGNHILEFEVAGLKWPFGG